MPEKIKPDKETQELLLRGEQLTELVKHEGWDHAKMMLQESILELGNIMKIDASDPQKVTIELKARQLSVKAIQDWLAKVEGEVENYKSSAEMFGKHQQDFIVRTD